ncbi:MAG: hypothetical protein ACOCTO_03505 [Marinilabiliaceae bacterium]
MTDHESTFNQWKEETRREALEKEVHRLHHVTKKQERKVRKLRRTLVLVILAAVVSLAALFFFALEDQQTSGAQFRASISRKDTAQLPQPEPEKEPARSDSPKNQPLKVMTPDSDTVEFFMPEDGIFFSVQIGAYLGIDLDKFRSNMISLHQDNSSAINQFTLGIFPTYQEANVFKKAVKNLGFEEAHIVAFQDGDRIKVKDALTLRNDSVPGQLTGR